MYDIKRGRVGKRLAQGTFWRKVCVIRTRICKVMRWNWKISAPFGVICFQNLWHISWASRGLGACLGLFKRIFHGLSEKLSCGSGGWIEKFLLPKNGFFLQAFPDVGRFKIKKFQNCIFQVAMSNGLSIDAAWLADSKNGLRFGVRDVAKKLCYFISLNETGSC